MAGFDKYEKSTVVTNVIIGTVVILTLMWLCVFASLHCELFILEVNGVVIAAFAIMPYLVLGGLYGYVVSLIAFLLEFI
jgi:hypothetical protein